MTVRAVSLTIVAFLIGALSAGGVGVRVIREVRTTEDATSLPAQNTAPTPSPERGYQVSPFETLITSAALVPTTAEETAGEFTISYDLVSLAPHIGPGGISPTASENVDPIYPRRWVIDTPKGAIEGGPDFAHSRSARFSTVDPLTLADVESVRIVEALASFPFLVHVILSEATPTVEIAPGVSVRLVAPSPIESGRGIEIAVDADEDSLVSVDVAGGGPGWTPSPDGPGAEPMFMVAWTGDGAVPLGVPLVVSGTAWVVVDGHFDVALGGLR